MRSVALNKRQELFAKEYLIDLNATQSAIRAGYSEKTAYSMGQRLLKHVEVQECIQKAMRKREKRTEVTQDRVLEELAAIAFADINDYVQISTVTIDDREIDSVELVNTGALPKAKRAAIAGIKQGANGIELKLYDKEKALEMLGRHLGMFNDKLKTEVDMELKVEVDYGDD